MIAHAIRTSWSATLDRKSASLIPADFGLAVVAVPPEERMVDLRYAAPYRNLGGWISGLTLLLLLTLAGYEWWRRRRT